MLEVICQCSTFLYKLSLYDQLPRQMRQTSNIQCDVGIRPTYIDQQIVAPGSVIPRSPDGSIIDNVM